MMSCGLTAVEVMGRDTSVVCTHPAVPGQSIRAIIGAEYKVDESRPTVHFRLRPNKVYLFDKETEERLR